MNQQTSQNELQLEKRRAEREVVDYKARATAYDHVIHMIH